MPPGLPICEQLVQGFAGTNLRVRRAASRICRKVACGRCALVNGNCFLSHSVRDLFVQTRAEIDFATDDFRQFTFVAEVTKSDIPQCARLKFREHIDVTAFGIKIRAKHRAEQAELANTTRAAKSSDLLTVNLDGQLNSAHTCNFREGFSFA